MDNNNVSLNEMMEKEPRAIKQEGPIDLTKGKVEVPKEETPKEVVAVQPKGPVDMSAMSAVNIGDILPKRADTEVTEAQDSLFADLDEAVDRECEKITERMDAIFEAQEAEIQNESDKDDVAEDTTSEIADDSDIADLGEDYFEDDSDESVDTNNKNNVTAISENDEIHAIDVKVEEVATNKPDQSEPVVARVTTEKKTSILDGINDEDLFADDDELNDDSSEDTNNDKIIEDLKKEAKEKILPIKKNFDLSKFSISKKSINAQKAMKLASQSNLSVADWALVSAKRPISMTGLTGAEIIKLNPENTSRNRLNTFRDMYRIMYDHVHDANKPEFETWLKQVKFADLQHIYFALYMATFNGSNFINYQCPHCNKIFLKDIKFEDMVVYKNDSDKDLVRSILKMDTNTYTNDEIENDLYQISDSYVFALRSPSIWNVVIETASLSDRFLEKHADLIDIVSYIEDIYIINEENQELIPIDTKPDPNDQAKTSARRIKAYHDIISGLTSEEFFTLRAYINTYDEAADKVTYHIPACTCPDCATEIPVNDEITPDGLLFIRHQLAAIANT